MAAVVSCHTPEHVRSSDGRAHQTVDREPVVTDLYMCPALKYSGRHTDVRALETSQDDNPPTKLAGDNTPDSLPQRMTRLDHHVLSHQQPRSHIRGARSLSPVRHGRTQSMQVPFTDFNARGVIATHAQNLTPRPRSRFNTIQRGDQAASVPDLRQLHLSIPLLDRAKDGAQNSQQLLNSPLRMQDETATTAGRSDLERDLQERAAVVSEEQFYARLVRDQPDASTTYDDQLDWASDVLQLCERKERRSRLLTDCSPEALPRVISLQREATSIVTTLSKESVPRGIFMEGTLHEFGRAGFAPDRKEALVMYKRASRLNFPRAEYRLGVQFERIGDIAKACESYEKGAAADDSACLYRMGMIILRGQYGYDVDEQKGINCIHLSALSADSDVPQGAYVWGLLLAGETTFPVSDRFLQRDMDQARTFIERAASLGFSAAQLRLGKAHEFNEIECDFDPALSWHYYMLAAQGGEPEGDMAMSKWSLAGSDDGAIQKDERRSFFHAAMAAKRGLASAEFAMGYYYEVGIACLSNLQRAQEYYRRAADHGSEEARSRIAGIARSGTLSRKDHDLNVSTRIQARHATIKLNATQVARRKDRATSHVSQPVATQHKDNDKEHVRPPHPQVFATAPKNTVPLSSDLPVQDLDQIIKDLQVSHPPQDSPKLADSLPGPDEKESHGHDDTTFEDEELLRSQGDAISQHPSPSVPDDQRRQSWTALPDHGAVPRGPIRRPVQLTDEPRHISASQDMYQSGGPGNRFIQTWNQQNASHAQVSPNTAPSELGSVLEGSPLSSPRPESSVSNVPPFVYSQQHAHSRNASSAATVPSQHTAQTIAASYASSQVAPSTNTSVSQTSNRRAGATTFEEMGIPIANKKKEDCTIM